MYTTSYSRSTHKKRKHYEYADNLSRNCFFFAFHWEHAHIYTLHINVNISHDLSDQMRLGIISVGRSGPCHSLIIEMPQLNFEFSKLYCPNGLSLSAILYLTHSADYLNTAETNRRYIYPFASTQGKTHAKRKPVCG